jgi:DNA-directed RNA polymerase specialized sigma24 family protein
VAVTASLSGERSFEEFVALHAERCGVYLRGLLGRQAEGRGGRVGVEDALQEALLAVYAEWPDLQDVRDEERDRRLYRCLRDAAGEALRAELGRRSKIGDRPRVIAFDFGAVDSVDEARPGPDRELAAVVLGRMARELAAEQPDHEARAMLDRGILVGALRALTEREAVVLLAVDHLGWDQEELAERMGMDFGSLRRVLFDARKIFYTLVRHAIGVGVDGGEQETLAAYLAGELRGEEKRHARRHLKHCAACQELEREGRVFGRDAVGVLSPLPFVLGARALVARSGPKPAAIGSGLGAGLLGQAGAAKALAVVFGGVLGVGVIGVSVLAQLQDHDGGRGGLAAPATMEVSYVAPPTGGMKRPLSISSTAPAKSRHKTKSHKHFGVKSRRRTTSSSASSRPASASTQAATGTQPRVGQQQSSSGGQTETPSTTSSKPKSSGGGCEFFGAC